MKTFKLMTMMTADDNDELSSLRDCGAPFAFPLCAFSCQRLVSPSCICFHVCVFVDDGLDGFIFCGVCMSATI
jgi:hypothetical protein